MAHSSEKFVTLRRYDEYYLPGGDLYFLVDRNHFRVHRYFYERESEFFRKILGAPSTPGAERLGTAENALVIDNVSARDFAKFNWVFYNPKYSIYEAPAEDWQAILGLAHRWGFREVHALSVRELEKLELPHIDRIVTYQQYEVNRQLLIPSYAALTEREEPLTLEEGVLIGIETAITIARAREFTRSRNGHAGTPSNVHGQEMQDIVQKMFNIVLVDDPINDVRIGFNNASPGSAKVNAFGNDPTISSINGMSIDPTTITAAASSETGSTFSESGDMGPSAKGYGGMGSMYGAATRSDSPTGQQKGMGPASRRMPTSRGANK